MKRNFIFFLGSAILILSSCATSKKIAALKPAASYNTGNVVYDKQLSYVNLPVEISVTDIQSQTNKYLNGLIYEDNNLEGDNLIMKVWKQAPIVVNEKNGKLQIEIPLKIWARVRYGIEKFGLSAYDTRDLGLNGKVKLSTTANLSNWKLNTTTSIDAIEWNESPSILIAGRSVPITYLVNPAISLLKGRLATMIDQTIEQSLDIKPYVISALQEVSKPMEVSTEYHTWFGMQPLELYATKATIANKKITVNLGMKAYLETTVGSQPTLKFDANKLQLMAVDKMPSEFSANIAGVVKYANASELMQKNFAGQKFESGSRSVTINKIDLWGKDDKLVVQATMAGSVNGDFYLSGIPKYNAETKEVYLDQVDFVLDSKNKLLRAGDWLVHGIIAKKIQDNCKFSIAEQLQDGQKTMATYLSNYQPVPGVKVNGSMTQLAPNKIFLTPNAIVAMIAAKGKVAIAIDGLK
ncbi:DUF4403 family protein [Pedobacter sp. HMF7647]|uniref:DUF4403 family protein n=1 Tax=Hufsiella arboris TaxID=2695275 RepID=A0A7K1YC74_9SPHI|nr:DUF4403 family protein [Hufsiella arboris]MXV52165.1 DUF4403 family protein [Hufsiella arboris]